MDKHSDITSHSIFKSYPEYITTVRLDELRRTEYGYLDEKNHVYLDYAGAGLAARAQIRSHGSRLESLISGNPHSTSPASHVSNEWINATRTKVLQFLNASPTEYSVVFTANATAAARLVGEAYPFGRRSKLVLTSDNHNSVNGLRCFAKASGARTTYVPPKTSDLRTATASVAAALTRRRRCILTGSQRSLFAYPAQSNFSGVQHPLEWINLAQNRGYDVMLDAAAYLSTKALDLSAINPDYVIISWYKLFGFPTGIGCLVSRHESLARLSRPWFSGGTVQGATTGIPWHAMNPGNAAFEDGTPNFLAVPDIYFGIEWLLSAGMSTIATRVLCLTGWFIDRLEALRHSDGQPLARIYGPTTVEDRGGTIAFNLIDLSGKIIDERLVAMEATHFNISIRTGCFCNPGAGEAALGLNKSTLRSLIRLKVTSFVDFVHLFNGPVAAVRVSFGIASTVADAEAFLSFIERTYKDRVTGTKNLPLREGC